METIDLTPYGHSKSPFERKLVLIKNNKYKAIGVLRIIGDIHNLYAIDFDGGPYLAVGSHIGDKTVKNIIRKDSDIYVYLKILTKDHFAP